MARISHSRRPPSQSSSPEPSSDKENRQISARVEKRSQAQTMASGANAKRQRLSNRTANIQSGSQSQVPGSQQDHDKQFYDPDQDEKERRRVRKGLRDLTRELHGTVSSHSTLFSNS